MLMFQYIVLNTLFESFYLLIINVTNRKFEIILRFDLHRISIR